MRRQKTLETARESDLQAMHCHYTLLLGGTELSLSEQEARCIDLACQYLASLHGGTWIITELLDETHRSEASPEVLVSNGSTTAAIEVKRLIGDDEYLTYLESMFSLEKYLAPSCGGYYVLNPALDFRLPMEPPFRRYVRREIERVAPSLAREQAGAIRIPRQAVLSLSRSSGPGFVYCCHNSTGQIVQDVSSRITGAFFLVDDHLWEHEFVTDEARSAFQNALVAACEKRAQGDLALFNWMEEWELTRGSDEGTRTASSSWLSQARATLEAPLLKPWT